MATPGNHELISEYAIHLRVERGLSDNTVMAYTSDLMQFAEVLEMRHQVLFRAEPADVTAHLVHLQKHDVHERARARKISTLRGFYDWLIKQQRLEKDPTRLAVTPKLKKLLPKFIAAETLETLLDTARRSAEADNANAFALRDYAMLATLDGGGLRVSELCGLGESDVNLKAGTALVMGKGGKERLVPIGAVAIDAIRNWKQFGRPQLRRPKGKVVTAMFLSQRGTQISRESVYRIVVGSTAEEHVHPHRFRHSCATAMLEGGADLRVVQEQLGHATPATTQIYTAVVPGHLQAAHRKFHPRG